jgi:hypothetical protein
MAAIIAAGCCYNPRVFSKGMIKLWIDLRL